MESGGGASISVLGVDILPAELPRESSHHFGESLVGVVKELLQAREHRVAETHGIDTTLLSPGLVRQNMHACALVETFVFLHV